ncbi:dipeptidase [Haloferacaceae archaeon DSL9]
MADDISVVDGHNDALLAAARDGDAFLDGTDGHLDLPRLRESPVAAGFFAIFVPNDAAAGSLDVDVTSGEYPPAVPTDVARRYADGRLETLRRWAAGDDFTLISTVSDLDACLDGDAVGAIPHLEGAAMIEPDLSNLPALVASGVRSVGLVWSRPNDFGRGVPFAHDVSPDTGPGLTREGFDLVEACDEHGVVIDCAHLNERGFWDVFETSDAPLVVSHSAAYAVCPATRNLTDEQLDAIAAADGIVGLTFAAAHLRPDGEHEAQTSLSIVCDHIDHLIDRMGIDHVGFGSDFDGAVVPNEIGDARDYGRLLDALADRGYDERDRRKLAFGNWRRVLSETWK